MNFFETLERIQYLHALIKSEHTGTPDELARRLGVCRKTLYNMIDELKSYNAPIVYSKRKGSFYYSKEFELELHCRFSIIKDEKTLKNTNGGCDFFVPYAFLHGTTLFSPSKVIRLTCEL